MVFFSKPPEYSDLIKYDGVVIEKWQGSVGKHGPDSYFFRLKTRDGIKKLSVAKSLVENCCFLKQVPLNEKVNVLTQWTHNGIFLYEINHDNKSILDAQEVLEKEAVPIKFNRTLALVLFLISAIAYCLELIRKKI